MIQRNEIQYRVGRSGKSKDGKGFYASFLVYIDSRTASRELDELYDGEWSFTWDQVENQKWAVKGCLRINKVQECIYEDVGYPNEYKKSQDPDQTEWLKDAISDALKRCAVQAGVGRFLYDAPNIYTEEVYTKERGGQQVYSGLTPMGKKEIEGRIDKWYRGLKLEEAKK